MPDDLLPLISPGTQVVVPFGQREIKGIVVSLSDSPKIDESKLKDIKEVPKKQKKIMGDLLTLSSWMKEYYACTLNQALRTCLPVKEKTDRRRKKAPEQESAAKAPEIPKIEPTLSDAQQKALDTFKALMTTAIESPSFSTA